MIMVVMIHYTDNDSNDNRHDDNDDDNSMYNGHTEHSCVKSRGKAQRPHLYYLSIICYATGMVMIILIAT